MTLNEIIDALEQERQAGADDAERIKAGIDDSLRNRDAALQALIASVKEIIGSREA